jgi:hypothetical protein
MENWEIVRAVATEEEALIAAGYLRSNGIPAEVESSTSSELPFTDGSDMGEARILVPADRLSEALSLLEERDAAAPAPEPDSAPAEPGQDQAEMPSVVEPE